MVKAIMERLAKNLIHAKNHRMHSYYYGNFPTTTTLLKALKFPIKKGIQVPKFQIKHTNLKPIASAENNKMLCASNESFTFFPGKRKKFRYEENFTAALSLPCTLEFLEKNKDNASALTGIAVKNIIEHANRRVDLFFYTLIAYYNSHEIPTLDRTGLQHGRGRNAGEQKSVTQACHSSMTPSLADLTGADRDQIKESVVSGTHFFDSLNSTVELPAFVNELDEKLEQHYQCREKSLLILRRVSMGEITPMEGINLFIHVMKTALQDVSNDMGHLTMPRGISPKLIKLVTQGTLSSLNKDNNKGLRDEYIQMMLRFSPADKQLIENTPSMKEALYLSKVVELQREILETKCSVKPSTTAP